MATVIERFKTNVDKKGFIHHNDRPTTYAKAEKLAGVKLDKRRNYAIIDGEVCAALTWTQPCTGCACDGEYPCGCCDKRGGGCEECGYTGKRRISQWIPGF